MGNEIQIAPEITLLKSEMEAAAARVAERAMNTTLDGVSGLVGDLFGGWFGDGIKQWRTRRLVDTLAKTRDHLEKNGVSIDQARALPMGDLLSIFEGASKQEDPLLTDMWAALLSNAMNPDSNIEIDPSFPTILGLLSGLDAVILDFLNKAEIMNHELGVELSNTKKTLTKFEKSLLDAPLQRFLKEGSDKIIADFGDDKASYSVANLMRVGLIFEEKHLDSTNQLVSISYKYNDVVEAEYYGLQDELSSIYYHLNMLSNNETNHKVVQFYDFQNERRYFRPYDLTALAKRLLVACH